jgi:hypothetical protein
MRRRGQCRGSANQAPHAGVALACVPTAGARQARHMAAPASLQSTAGTAAALAVALAAASAVALATASAVALAAASAVALAAALAVAFAAALAVAFAAAAALAVALRAAFAVALAAASAMALAAALAVALASAFAVAPAVAGTVEVAHDDLLLVENRAGAACPRRATRGIARTMPRAITSASQDGALRPKPQTCRDHATNGGGPRPLSTMLGSGGLVSLRRDKRGPAAIANAVHSGRIARQKFPSSSRRRLSARNFSPPKRR